MSQIGKLWAGQVYGTNTGNLFVEFENTEGELKGTLRFADDKFGPVVHAIRGSFDGENLHLTGEPTKTARDGVINAPIEVRGKLTPEGVVRGTWSSERLGTGGTFIMHPHDLPSGSPSGDSVLPERLHTATRSLGAIRLYAEDLAELIGFVGRDFGQPRVVVTYFDRGSQTSRYSNDFLSDTSKPADLRYLKLVVQEPEAYGINRVVIVELNADGVNEIRSQGVQESWVLGKAEALASFLRQHQKMFVTSFRRLGLNFTGFFILGSLIFLPELSLGRRFLFLVAVLLIAWSLVEAHTRFIPNALIYTGPKKPGALKQAWPQILSWLMAATAGLAAAVAYGALKGELPWWP